MGWGANSENALRSTDSQIEQSQLSVHSPMREYGNMVEKSTASVVLPFTVRQQIGSNKTNALGSKDPEDLSVKANGLALQVQVTAVDDLPYAVFENQGVTQFESVTLEDISGSSNSN